MIDTIEIPSPFTGETILVTFTFGIEPGQDVSFCNPEYSPEIIDLDYDKKSYSKAFNWAIEKALPRIHSDLLEREIKEANEV